MRELNKLWVCFSFCWQNKELETWDIRQQVRTYTGVSGGFAPEGGEGLRKQAKKTFGEKDLKQRGAHTSKP